MHYKFAELSVSVSLRNNPANSTVQLATYTQRGDAPKTQWKWRAHRRGKLGHMRSESVEKKRSNTKGQSPNLLRTEVTQ